MSSHHPDYFPSFIQFHPLPSNQAHSVNNSLSQRRPKCFALQQFPSTGDDQEPDDQWTQYERRDRKSLQKHLSQVRSYLQRECHHHVFLQQFSIASFTNAASRFVNYAAKYISVDINTQRKPRRLWVLRAIEDPTFGLLRGEPYPPRAIIMERLPKLLPDDIGRHHVAEDFDAAGVRKWIAALDRTGNILSPMESHTIEWASCGGNGIVDTTTLPENALVACEIVNANWIYSSAVPGLRDILLKHSKLIVETGHALSYEVLQSVDEPTCFKTIEIYKDMDQLESYMNSIDNDFEKEAETHRAAVYRVRQLYQPLYFLDIDSTKSASVN